MSKVINAKGFPSRPFKGITPKEEYKTQILYNLDDKTDELYVVGEQDVQAMVDSYATSALDYILDRFLNHNETPVVSPVVDYHNTISKLEECEKVYDYRLSVCEKLGLPIDTDINAIKEHINNKIKDFKESEGVKDETKKNEQSEVEENV